MTTDPEITEDVFNRVLAEPEALKVLEVLAAREGITTPFLEIPREKQFEIVAAMMEMARNAQEQADGGSMPQVARLTPYPTTSSNRCSPIPELMPSCATS